MPPDAGTSAAIAGPEDRTITTVILAGGKGARMGGNKPFHSYRGSTLIEATVARLRLQTDRICINAGVRDSALAIELARLGLPLIFDDRHAGLGPLSGVLSALKYAHGNGQAAVITTPCDMPLLPGHMMAQLLQERRRNAGIIHFTGIRDYPLCALWQVSVAADLDAALAATSTGGLSVMRFLSTQKLWQIPTTDNAAFANINAPEPAMDLMPHLKEH